MRTWNKKNNYALNNAEIKNLYKNKLKEYEKVDHEIKATRYWINKERNV